MKKFRIKNVLLGERKIDSSLGSEIRRRRLLHNQTLAQVSDNICSVSYTSKVENSLIYPKMSILRQICDNLDISENQMDSLVNMENILRDAVESFYYDDKERLEQIYDEIHSFNNYRADIIKVIYYISICKYNVIPSILETIDKMLDSLGVEDVLVYAVFSSVFYTRKDDFFESKEVIRTISDHFKPEHEILKTIAFNCLCENYFQLNNVNFTNLYDEVLNKNLVLNQMENVENFKYLNFLFNYRNNDIKAMERCLLSLKGESKYLNCKALLELSKENQTFFTSSTVKVLDYYVKCLYAHKYAPALFRRIIVDLDNEKLATKNYIHLKYLSMPTATKRMDYLEKTCFPHSINVLDEYFASIYGEVLIMHYSKSSTYKKALKISEDLRELIRGKYKL